VVVQLADGSTQYYWVQDVVGLNNGYLYVEDDVWNTTTFIFYLSPANIHGNGEIYYSNLNYYYYYKWSTPISFGWVSLKMSTYTSDGNVVINFYANGQEYDTVTIIPSSPAVSAYIEIAPTATPAQTPLNLELVFSGYSGDVPYAILQKRHH
jgi:hypothetical protein